MHWCRNLKRLGKTAGPSVSVILAGKAASQPGAQKCRASLRSSRDKVPGIDQRFRQMRSVRERIPIPAPAAGLALVRGRRRAFNEHRICLHPRPTKLQQALGKLPKVISSPSGRKLPCTLQDVCDLGKDRHFACESFHFSNLGLKVAILRVSCHNSIACPSTNGSARVWPHCHFRCEFLCDFGCVRRRR
jgi:hypothetical protein